MIEKLEEECGSLDSVLAGLILPKLLYFKNWCVRYGIPAELEEDEWEEILDEMVWAFTFKVNDPPRLTSLIIEDTIMHTGEPEDYLIPMTIEFVYKEGYTEEDYNNLREKDISNMYRCQRGTTLFGKYFSSLWN